MMLSLMLNLGNGTAAPVITIQPVDAVVAQGLPALFTATCIGTGPITWQAYLNGAAISGASGTGTVATYETADTVFATDNGGEYSFIFANSGGPVVTANALLTVVPPVFSVPFLTGVAARLTGRYT